MNGHPADLSILDLLSVPVYYEFASRFCPVIPWARPEALCHFSRRKLRDLDQRFISCLEHTAYAFDLSLSLHPSGCDKVSKLFHPSVWMIHTP